MNGIYKITNRINKKSYIGQSIHIEQLWQEHLYQSTKCSLIKYALFKYGQENFTFEVIEECP
jgi:group I intron endonuclease